MSRPVLDHTGTKYGSLTVLYLIGIRTLNEGSGTYNRTFWKCKCDCGRLIEIASNSFSTWMTCGGCERTPDLSGQTFGELTVLRLIPPAERTRWKDSRAWECKCSCGQVVRLMYSQLVRGLKKSCGCIRAPRLKDFRSAARQIYKRYRAGAKTRKLEFSLSEDEFYSIIVQNCHYTGSEPEKSIRTQSGLFRWNGVDRVDNKQGYIPGNVVPCSEWANRAKMDLTYDEFVQWLDKTARYRMSSGCPENEQPKKMVYVDLDEYQ